MSQYIFESTNILSMIDWQAVIFLMAVGFMLKHFVPTCDNRIIPAIILIISLLYYAFSIIPFTDASQIGNVIVNAFVSAALAVGLHNYGKPLFRMFVGDSYTSPSSTSTEETYNTDSVEDKMYNEESVETEVDTEEKDVEEDEKTEEK